MPCMVYRRGDDGTATIAADSNLYKRLHDSPNADQTAVDYWEFVIISLLLRGNHFARKVTEGGRLVALEPIRPDIVTVSRRADGGIRYQWSEGRDQFDLGEDDVFHVRGFGGGPLGGWSVLKFARNSLGLAIAADQAASAMFANGVRPSGVLQFKDWLKAEQREDAHDLVQSQFMGAMNHGRPFILEGGASWSAISLNAEDSQLLQSRAWSVEDVCRWLGIPPVLLGHNEKTTSWGSGIEQMLLWFQKFTLNPYLVRIEQAIRQQLITAADQRAGLFAEFKVEGLLRADSKARAEFYSRALGDTQKPGWMVRNEVRRLENLPPIEGWDEPISLFQQAPGASLPGTDDNGEKAMRFGVKRQLKVRDFALSVKADKVGDDGTFEGYGSVFGVVDSYQEIVAAGAFTESLVELAAKGRKVPVLWQHRTDQPIGVYLKLVEDDHGLKVEGQLLIDAVAQAAEAHALMKAGAVTGLSIGYWVRESSYDEKTGIRTLTKLDLVEVSLVTMPACDEARVEAVKFKLAHGELPNIKEFEKLLREAGFSKTQAAVVAGHGLPELLRREAAGDATKEGVDALSAALAGIGSLPSFGRK